MLIFYFNKWLKFSFQELFIVCLTPFFPIYIFHCSNINPGLEASWFSPYSLMHSLMPLHTSCSSFRLFPLLLETYPVHHRRYSFLSQLFTGTLKPYLFTYRCDVSWAFRTFICLFSNFHGRSRTCLEYLKNLSYPWKLYLAHSGCLISIAWKIVKMLILYYFLYSEMNFLHSKTG